MLFFGNPCGSELVVDAMRTGSIGCIDTPGQGARPADARFWCADNGAFTDRFVEDTWWRFLEDNAYAADTCVFAVAPDVVGDAAATLERSRPWLSKIRSLRYPAAFVAQDGVEDIEVPWDEFDVLFIGGTDTFKLGPSGRRVAAEAKAHRKGLHMGRVNSERRFAYARSLGCDSVDGTYLTFGPDKNLRDVLAWTRLNDHDHLFNHEGVAP